MAPVGNIELAEFVVHDKPSPTMTGFRSTVKCQLYRCPPRRVVWRIMNHLEIRRRIVSSFSLRKCFTVSFLAVLMFCQQARAEVRLPKVFSSHMVLQQEKPIVVWGWADPNETVTVRLADATQQVKANDQGEWKATRCRALSAGGPFTLTVSGSTTVTFDDVLVGEVWLCSGQSNMEMGIGQAQNGVQEIAAADYPKIRLLKVPKRWSVEPQNDVDAAWKVCTPTTVAEGGWNGFSAAGYYFGREFFQKLNVPIGLIDSTWGGTRIESWTPPEGFAAVPALHEESEHIEMGDVRTEAHQKGMEQLLKDTEQWLDAARAATRDHKQVPAMPNFPKELQGASRRAKCHGVVQWHDSSFDAVRHPRRDLVSG